MNFTTLIKSGLALLFTLLYFGNTSIAQIGNEEEFIRCGTMENLENEIEKDPGLLNRRKQIEQDIEDYINNPLRELDGDTVIIPIVFHVIHDGDPIGSNENIDDVYIEAQLDQLNDDFRRMNSDADGTWSQAADTWIEFCLAQTDPDGNSTTGIIRHNISGGPWSSSTFNSSVKPSTIWDRDNYCNFWIADLSGGLLGYAQFPGGNANTDGVVCLYSSVGSIDTPNPDGGVYDLGRTGTHEIGHWLDLFHIWGDDGTSCSGSDSCADTPNQAGSTSGCPSGVQTDACATTSPGYMYQNYMDYSYDECMNIFTVNQRDRMQACLNGERSSLLTASCGDPIPPTANFNPDSGTEILCGVTADLSFTDLSSGTPDTWSWTFSGAGVSPTSSTAQNPTVTLSASGNLTATLTATNGLGSDTHSGTVIIDLRPLSDPLCQVSPCLDFEGGPYTNFNYADACAQTGCPEIVTTFEVWENEAYTLAGLIGGLDYTFEFCTGYDSNDWDAVITVGEYDSVTDAAIPNSEFAFVNDCSVTFTAPFDGDFIVVVTGEGNCGGAENDVDNGEPTFSCITECVTQCGMLFTDAGGVDFNYRNNEDKTYILCPDDPTCEVIETDFTFFDLRNNHTLAAYNGDNISAPLLGSFSGSNSPGTLISTHSTGCLTFTFDSNAGNGTDPGWEATITCIDDGTCVDCPDDYAGANALIGPESGNGGINGNGDYETDGAIESTQRISAGTIDYDSGTGIDLNSGFEISAGAEVDIFIDGCDDGGGGNTLIEEGGDDTRRATSNKNIHLVKEKVGRK